MVNEQYTNLFPRWTSLDNVFESLGNFFREQIFRVKMKHDYQEHCISLTQA